LVSLLAAVVSLSYVQSAKAAIAERTKPYQADSHTVVLYHFDEQIKPKVYKDAASPGSDGFARGNIRALDPTFVPGMGRAITVSGINGDCLRATPGAGWYKQTDGFTVEAWIKHRGSSNKGTIAAQFDRTGGNLEGFLFRIEKQTEPEPRRGRLNVVLGDGSTRAEISGKTQVDDGRDHHAAMTYRYDAKARRAILALYIDGKIDLMTNVDQKVVIPEAPLFVAGIGDEEVRWPLNGAMDEFRLSSVVRTFAAAERTVTSETKELPVIHKKAKTAPEILTGLPILMDNTVLSWRMDAINFKYGYGLIRDTSVKTNHGRIVGDVGLSKELASHNKERRAIVLDRPGQCISSRYNPSLNLGDSFRLEIRVNPKQTLDIGSPDQFILAKCSYDPIGRGYALFYSKGRLRFWQSDHIEPSEISSKCALQQDRWHHIVVASEESLGRVLIIDGKIVDYSPAVVAMAPYEGNLVVGALNTKGEHNFRGMLSYLKIGHIRAGMTDYLRETKFDKDLIEDSDVLQPDFPLANGKQLVRTRTGEYILMFDSGNGSILLTWADADTRDGCEFKQPIVLAGPQEKAAFYTQHSRANGGSIAVDRDNNLHFVWGAGQSLCYARVSLTQVASLLDLDNPGVWRAFDGKSPAPQVIAKTQGVLSVGDIVVRDGSPVVCYAADGSIFVATKTNGRWAGKQLAKEGSEPVMAVGNDGVVHLAYQHDFRIYYSVTADGERGTTSKAKLPGAEVAAYAYAFHPSIVLYRNRPLIVYQHEGMVDMEGRNLNAFQALWKGIASVGYAYFDGNSWIRDYVSYSKLRPFRWAKHGKMVEQQWRPVAGVDRFGVPFAVWPDTTRRYLYYARWQGRRFGDRFAFRGPFYLPSQHCTVEKRMPAEATSAGFAYVAADRIYFGLLPFPEIASAFDCEYHLLDLIHFESIEDLSLELNRFERHPGNPVFEGAGGTSWDFRHVGQPRVYRKDGKFHMIYIGGKRPRWLKGYAVSEDGIHWKRQEVGLVEYEGSRQNNIVPNVMFFDDADEADPDKRFKGLEYRGAGSQGRQLGTSPDGIHWVWDPKVSGNPILSSEAAGPNYRDPYDVPERRYKALVRVFSRNGRGAGLQYSPDMLNWYGTENILAVDDPYGKPPKGTRAWLILEADGGIDEDQIYDSQGWVGDGICWCAYFPCRYDGRYEMALAISRDSLNFYRIKNGSRVLPCSGSGNWDNGKIRTSVPMVYNDEYWLYYSASGWHHDTHGDPVRPAFSVGLAKMRVNGWTYFRVADGRGTGQATTIPVALAAGGNRVLTVNVSGVSAEPRGGRLLVELLQPATLRPIEGFSREDCTPVVQDGLRVPVCWAGRRTTVNLAPCDVQIRFHLDGSQVRLYSFGFHGGDGVK